MAKRRGRQGFRKRKNSNYRRRRRDRLEVLQRFLIVCEGEKTEPRYFEGFRVPQLVVDVKGLGNDPKRIVEEAIRKSEEAEYNQVWCVFDRDDVEVGDFNGALQRARSQQIQVAYSNQAFELWYLLHFDFHNTAISRRDYVTKLSKSMGREYRKNDSRMFDLLSSRQNTAIQNANRLLGQYSPHNPASDNPSTTVHTLVTQLKRFLPEARKS